MTSVIAVAASGVFSGAFLVSIVSYVKDFRKNRAAGTVAARTVELTVDAKRLANLEARLKLTEEAHDAERTAMRATIQHQEIQLKQARMELDEKDRKIAALRSDVDRMEIQIRHMVSKLDDLENGK